MTNKTTMIGLVAIAFVAGSIMTGTLAEAKKDKDGDGDGIKEGIVHEITGILNHATHGLETIQNTITSVQSDTTIIKSNVEDIKTETDKIPMIESDVTAIKTETDKITSVNADIGDIKTETDKIPMIKSDVGDIKTETDKIQDLQDDIDEIKSQLASASEPLTQFRSTLIFSDDNDERVYRDIDSTGPMLIELCPRDDIGKIALLVNGNFQTFLEGGDEWCQKYGVEPNQSARIYANVNEFDATSVYVFIRTTPSATLTISDPVTEDN